VLLPLLLMDWLCFQEMGVGLAVYREGGVVTYSHLILVMDWLCFQEMGVGLAVFREVGEVTYSHLILVMDWLCFQEMGVGLAVFREGGEVTYSHLILVMDWLFSGNGSGTGRIPRGGRGDLPQPVAAGPVSSSLRLRR
jgi:hypothetical protein